MTPPKNRKCDYLCQRLVAWGMIALAASPSMAALRHQYTFNNGTPEDSGLLAQHGTLIGTNGSITGGQLVLANTGESSENPGTTGAYLNLPNGLISQAALSGSGSVTVEMWITMQQHRDWSAAFSAGISSGGEDSSSPNNDDQPYLQVIPRTGDGGLGNDFRVTTNSYGSGMAGEEGFIDDSSDLMLGVKEHIVAIFDQPGGIGTGTITVYRNKVLVPAVPTEGLGGAIAANLDLTTFERADFTGGDVNIWLGRSQWPDALINARYDEFRIYDSALTFAEVEASYDAGPVPVSLPVLHVNRSTGEITITNPGASGFNLTGYTISSASGALASTTWTSVNAGDTFDPNGTWTTSSLTVSSIAESVTGGTLDGGTILGSSSRSIGNAWTRTPLPFDIQFTYTLNGMPGTQVGFVDFSGSAPARSDLNGDGLVDAADWALYVPNSYTSVAGLSPVEAYLKGDLDGDLDNDYFDFKIFKADFVAANGLAAFEALTFNVPEPSGIVLLVTFCAALLGTCRMQ